MTKNILLDSSFLFRLIFKDDQIQLGKIYDLLEKAESGEISLLCKNISVLEIAFVLSSNFYEVEKSKVIKILQTILNLKVIEFENVDILQKSLIIFSKHSSISLIESFLISECLLNNLEFYSLNQKTLKVFKNLQI